MPFLTINQALLSSGCAALTLFSSPHTLRQRLNIAPSANVDVGEQIPTLTPDVRFGFTTETPGLYGWRFQDFMIAKGNQGVAVDVGPAWYGVNTIPLLRNGVTVIAIEAEEAELNGLVTRVKTYAADHPNEYYFQQERWADKLRPLHQRLPAKLDIKTNSVDGVFLGSILHLLPPEEVMKTMREVYRILKPCGYVFMENQAPFMAGMNAWRAERAAKHRRDMLRGEPAPRWPWEWRRGEGGSVTGNIDYMNFFDDAVTKATLIESGFVIPPSDPVSYFARGGFPNHKIRYPRRVHWRKKFEYIPTFEKLESVGGIAHKPARGNGVCLPWHTGTDWEPGAETAGTHGH